MEKEERIQQFIKDLAEVDYKIIHLELEAEFTKRAQDEIQKEIILKQTERLNILIKIESEKSCPF